MCFANYSKSSVRLNNDTKTREARELCNVREVVGPSMKILVLEICLHLFVISPLTVFCSLWYKRQ